MFCPNKMSEYIMEINPYLEHIKDLTDRGNQLRGYL
jgi:hypothetical protein